MHVGPPEIEPRHGLLASAQKYTNPRGLSVPDTLQAWFERQALSLRVEFMALPESTREDLRVDVL